MYFRQKGLRRRRRGGGNNRLAHRSESLRRKKLGNPGAEGVGEQYAVVFADCYSRAGILQLYSSEPARANACAGVSRRALRNRGDVNLV